MAAITWDNSGKRIFEFGIDHGVLYPLNSKTNAYDTGVAWNGLTGVTETSAGAEASDMWADNIKYGSIRSTETFSATIEAYTYPDEFSALDGQPELGKGIKVGQQTRAKFGVSYRTRIGNDTAGDTHGYKLHLVYGLTASPSEKAYTTVNDSPEGTTFSWECQSDPVSVPDMKPTSIITIDSTLVDSEKLKTFEDLLYGGGSTSTAPKLPLPDQVKQHFLAS